MRELPNVTLMFVDCVDYDRVKKVQRRCERFFKFGASKILTHFEVDDPSVVRIPKISNIKAYSYFMLEELTKYVDTDYVLIAQWDGFIWHPELWTDEFLEYDYIGAPIPTEMIFSGAPRHFNIGNGGFSLRSKKLCDITANDPNIIKHWYEDIAIGQLNRAYLQMLGLKYPSTEVASLFSWQFGPQKPAFGVHASLKFDDVEAADVDRLP